MCIEVTPEYLASQGLSPTFPERFWKKVNKDGPIPKHMPHLGKCWVWTAFLTEHGYGRLWAGKRGDGMILAHVGSWIIHHGPVPFGLCVCHHCDNRPCQNPDHLWTGDNSENHRDKIKKGRQAYLKGEINGNSVLTSSQVIEIRKEYSSGGISQLSLAIRFGVSERNIHFIVHRLHWKHI